MDDSLLTCRDHSFSHSVEYNCGVSQGSCSGQLLWIIVANTLLRHFEGSNYFANDKLLAFADLRARNREEIIANTKRAFLLMSAWCRSHHLKALKEKTQLLIVCPRRPWNYSLKFDLDGDSFRNSAQKRYLGVIFHNRLSCTPHFDFVEQKVMQKLASFS